LPQELERCRPEDEKAAGPAAAPAARVDEAAQRLEQPRRPLNLVEDDELVLVPREVILRLPEPVVTSARALLFPIDAMPRLVCSAPSALRPPACFPDRSLMAS